MTRPLAGKGKETREVTASRSPNQLLLLLLLLLTTTERETSED
jgi:hypothetical protein